MFSAMRQLNTKQSYLQGTQPVAERNVFTKDGLFMIREDWVVGGSSMFHTLMVLGPHSFSIRGEKAGRDLGVDREQSSPPGILFFLTSRPSRG